MKIWAGKHPAANLGYSEQDAGAGKENVKVTSVVSLCDSTDCSPPGSSVHGILQARILEWVAFPSPGDPSNPGIEPRSPALQADSLLSEPPGKPAGEKHNPSHSFGAMSLLLEVEKNSKYAI